MTVDSATKDGSPFHKATPPDLDDIMQEGIGLTDALAFWSYIAGRPCLDWREELSFWRLACQQPVQGSC